MGDLHKTAQEWVELAHKKAVSNSKKSIKFNDGTVYHYVDLATFEAMGENTVRFEMRFNGQVQIIDTHVSNLSILIETKRK